MNTSNRKIILMSMNWYRNAHYGIKDKIKKQYRKMIYYQVKKVKQPFNKQIKVNYKLYYKNPHSDLMNIVSVIDKFLLDAIVEYGLISDDNVKKYVACKAEAVEKDVNNPRLVCFISEVEE